MGLHDRISGRNGNGAAAEVDHSSYAAPQRDESSERTGPVDPYAEPTPKKVDPAEAYRTGLQQYAHGDTAAALATSLPSRI